jgi:hypothetical protein
MTHREKSIVLLTIWAIPAIAVSIWNITVVVAKPAVHTDRKFVPVNKNNIKWSNRIIESVNKYNIVHSLLYFLEM